MRRPQIEIAVGVVGVLLGIAAFATGEGRSEMTFVGVLFVLSGLIGVALGIEAKRKQKR